jgi:hypothetical protein
MIAMADEQKQASDAAAAAATLPAPAASSPAPVDQGQVLAALLSAFTRMEHGFTEMRAAIIRPAAEQQPASSSSSASLPSSTSTSSSAAAQPDAARASALFGVASSQVPSLIEQAMAKRIPVSQNPYTALDVDIAPAGSDPLTLSLVAALANVGKSARRFKSRDEFAKGLERQFKALVAKDSASAVLSSWNSYSIYVLELVAKVGLDPVQDYHFELMDRLKDGTHDLSRDGGHYHGELFSTHIAPILASIAARAAAPRRSASSSSSSSSSSSRSRPLSRLHCSEHGTCGHSTEDCNVLKDRAAKRRAKSGAKAE